MGARCARNRTWRIAAIAVLTAVVAAVLAVYVASLPTRRPARPPASAPYSWPHGTPAGITLSELQSYEVTPGLLRMMKKQIRAAAEYWHANTVRLQIMQDRLVGAEGRRFDRRYMDAIRAVTDYALHLGLTVVLNAQTEMSTGYAVDEPLPTHVHQPRAARRRAACPRLAGRHHGRGPLGQVAGSGCSNPLTD